jgi:DNA-binding NarL/FixJ family response regulator
MEAAQDYSDPVRVLIVDDEPLFVEMIQAMLSAEPGIDVVETAADGRAAVDRVQELEPDVIVMDVSMPVMDGIEATLKIRQANPDACVLILTGGASLADIDRARTAGAAAYVTKDRISTDLVAEIRSLARK